MKIQYCPDNRIWEYTPEDYRCECGCNVFHRAYSEELNKIFLICNSCAIKAAELKDEYTNRELSKGIWIEVSDND